MATWYNKHMTRRIDPATGYQQCTVCREFMDPEHFGINNASPYGRNARCKLCSADYQARRKAAKRGLFEPTDAELDALTE
jgi:hypothetical protein